MIPGQGQEAPRLRPSRAVRGSAHLRDRGRHAQLPCPARGSLRLPSGVQRPLLGHGFGDHRFSSSIVNGGTEPPVSEFCRTLRDDHLSGALVSDASMRPTWGDGGAGHTPPLYAVLLRVGFNRARPRHRDRGALLPHRFTLAPLRPTRGRAPAGGLLSVALSVGSRPLGLPSTLPYGVRLSSEEVAGSSAITWGLGPRPRHPAFRSQASARAFCSRGTSRYRTCRSCRPPSRRLMKAP